MATAQRTLDCRDAVCPGPVIEVSRAMRALPPGEVLEVLATDPGFIPDIQAFSRRTGHRLVRVDASGEVLRAWIARAH